jgi:hypothetical protein
MNWLTVIVTAIAVAAPAFISSLPPKYGGPLSGILAGASAMYHLYRAPPGSSVAPPAGGRNY